MKACYKRNHDVLEHKRQLRKNFGNPSGRQFKKIYKALRRAHKQNPTVTKKMLDMNLNTIMQ